MRLRTAVITVAAILSAAATHAQTPPPAPPSQTDGPVISNPDWITRPTSEDVDRFYPPAAAAANVSGRTRMACVVAANGFLTRCRITEETPTGAGFGAAALAMASIFQMRPQTRAGQPVGGASITIPINWMIQGGGGGRITAYQRREAERERRFAQGDTAVPRDRPSAMVVRPRWLAAPTRQQMISVGATVDGTVTLRCSVGPDGGLGECRAIAERPEGAGLGRLAERLGPLFRVDTAAMEDAGNMTLVADVPVAFSTQAPEYVTRPTYAFTPTGAEIETALRAIAAAQPDITARAALDCRVGDAGALTDCRVTSATPDAAGPALMALSGRFTVRPWTEDGYPTGGSRVRLPLRYVAD